MEPESKKRRIGHAISRSVKCAFSSGCRMVSSPAAKNDVVSTSTDIPTVPLPAAHPGGIHFRIEQARRHAVAQAQQEGCTANFKIFDSRFGNFLLPVIPTHAELNG
ncbi:hypothetical protein CK203_071210 [Vitis vinifera]|uniref:Uncharacterized protein n=1 Tax=Vitis vinifera TaxID=29760 RepID=A0A438DS93_VITVI|nr:hypothetical protein CK203_071210 [Vitis vinifera]